MKIRLSGIIEESIVDGPGIRFVIFTQGCPHNCEGCHNPETHSMNGGYLEDIENIFAMFKRHPYMSGLTLSGGEPFMQIDEILFIIKEFKKMYPTKNVVIYTGFEYENLINKNDKINEILNLSDYLIDGKFILNKRDISLIFRGSSNQRIIDLKKSLKDNDIIIKEF